MLAEKRALAEALRRDPSLFERTKAEAGSRLVDIPVMAKGVPQSNGKSRAWLAAGAALAGLGAFLVVRRPRPAT
jgi:hypothetical protein